MITVGCWGTGRMAEKAVGQIEACNLFIKFFCDKDETKRGGLFLGKPILSPSELKGKMQDIDLLVITTGYWESVFQDCMDLQIETSKVMYWNCEHKKLQSIDEMYTTSVYSQFGEEIYLKNKFQNKEYGTYVDIGSFHPFRFSNTYWAYLKGWTGINIEPNITNYQLFEKYRSRDININCGISNVEGTMQLYKFAEGALNTFDFDIAKHYESMAQEVKSIVDVKVYRLDNILREYQINKVDFLDIDTEGMEMQVLESIDFHVDIECILLEQGDVRTFSDIINSREGRFLQAKGYEAVNRFGITTLYEKKMHN